MIELESGAAALTVHAAELAEAVPERDSYRVLLQLIAALSKVFWTVMLTLSVALSLSNYLYMTDLDLF